MSKKICPIHGLYSTEICMLCKKVSSKNYDKSRDEELIKFYNSTKWRKISKAFLKNNPLCIVCKRPATLTDHIKEIKDGGSRYSWDNLQPMCNSCHNKKTAKERAKRGGAIKSLETKKLNTDASSKFSETSRDGGTPL